MDGMSLKHDIRDQLQLLFTVEPPQKNPFCKQGLQRNPKDLLFVAQIFPKVCNRSDWHEHGARHGAGWTLSTCFSKPIDLRLVHHLWMWGSMDCSQQCLAGKPTYIGQAAATWTKLEVTGQTGAWKIMKCAVWISSDQFGTSWTLKSSFMPNQLWPGPLAIPHWTSVTSLQEGCGSAERTDWTAGDRNILRCHSSFRLRICGNAVVNQRWNSINLRFLSEL